MVKKACSDECDLRNAIKRTDYLDGLKCKLCGLKTENMVAALEKCENLNCDCSAMKTIYRLNDLNFMKLGIVGCATCKRYINLGKIWYKDVVEPKPKKSVSFSDEVDIKYIDRVGNSRQIKKGYATIRKILCAATKSE
jgi:hypothetical protein